MGEKTHIKKQSQKSVEQPKRRIITPDRKYNDVMFHKLINNVMYDGLKSTAEDICYFALEKAAKKLEKDPIELFKKVVQNVTPEKSTKQRKVGGSNYAVPVEIPTETGNRLALKIIVQEMRKIKRTSKLKAQEILAQIFEDSYNNKGAAISVRNSLHHNADANKAFANYRW